MSRPRTPTGILENRGAYINHPERAQERADEPIPTADLPIEPPAFLSKFQKIVWTEFVRLIPKGVAGDCDLPFIVTAVKLYAKVRRGSFKGTDVSQLLTCLSRLGMTPADRSRVKAKVQAEATKSAWDEIDEEAPVQ